MGITIKRSSRSNKRNAPDLSKKYINRHAPEIESMMLHIMFLDTSKNAMNNIPKAKIENGLAANSTPVVVAIPLPPENFR